MSGVDQTAQEIREHQFVEEFGLLLTNFGMTPMFGRIMGYLLVCDPPEQSSGDIASALAASKGSVSITTRQLLTSGMIEKVPRRGSRATYFRVLTGAWADMMRIEMARMLMMREMAEHGLTILNGADPSRRHRLEELRDFFLFMEQEWPRLVDHWNERKQRKEDP